MSGQRPNASKPDADRESDRDGNGDVPRSSAAGQSVSGISITEAPVATTADESSTEWIGRVLEERYRIESLLGEGGMGAVFLAEHIKLGKKVAVKVIHPHFAGNGEIAERFAREAMTSARIEHPNVAGALDFGTLPEGGAYLVMPFVKGRSLRDALLEGTHGWRFAAEVGAQIADALSAAHAANVVHRDLKPENVMLVPREGGGELVRVLDFGIARVVRGDAEPTGQTAMLTQIGTVIGTPGYMAPEQAIGERVDARADIYALGVVLWECVSGKQLFEGGDLTSIVMAQLTTTPPPLREIASDIPPEFDSLVEQLLAKTRDERVVTASQVRDTLQHVAWSAANPPAPAPESPDSNPQSGALALDSVADGARLAQQELGRNLELVSHRFRAMSMSTRVGVAVAAGAAFMTLCLVVLVPVLSSSTPHYTKSDVPTPNAEGRSEDGSPAGLLAPLVDALPSLIGRHESPELQTLLRSDNVRERREAAEAIARREDIPEFERLLVRMELERSCNARRRAFRGLMELGDERNRVLLERLDAIPRRGCGFMRAQDCNLCLRRLVDGALDR